MAQRGRKSAASLAVVSGVAGEGQGITQRLHPPPSLTPAQRIVWLETVSNKPAEWFGPEHVPLLESYCRHVIQARLLAEQLEKFDPEWLKGDEGLKRYGKLLNLHKVETGRVNDFARAMRLTHQAVYRADKAATLERKGRAPKPWEVEG